MKYFKLLSPIALILSLLLGCSKIDDEISPNPSSSKQSVLPMKEWYISSLSQPQEAKKSQSTLAASILPLVDWQNATQAEGADAFIVPIGDTRKNRFASIDLKGSRRLLIWLDKTGSKKANIVEFYTVSRVMPDTEIKTACSLIAVGLRAGKVTSLGTFDGNVIIYSKEYNNPSGRSFRNGKAIGSYTLTVSGGSQLQNKRIGSTSALASSCNYQDCNSYCGSVCVDGGGCHTDCYRDCTGYGPSDPSDPATPGPPTTGGGFGGGTPSDGTSTSDDGTTSKGPGIPPDSPSSLGDHAVICQGNYLLGKLRVLVEINSVTHTIEKITLYYTGTLPPGSEVKQLGDGTASYNAYTGQYSARVYFNVTSADGSLNSKQGYVDIDLHSTPDYFGETGWDDRYTMTRTGG